MNVVIKPRLPITVRAIVGAALAVVFLYVIPFVIPNYLVSQFATVLVFAIAIVGINLVTGFGGAITLGHQHSLRSALTPPRFWWCDMAGIPMRPFRSRPR
jgi:hypothetical protein